MPGENLTRAEAAARAQLLSVESYQVALDLTVSDRVFKSTTTVNFNSHQAGAGTFIDAITDKVHRVILNGVELDGNAVADGTRIQLDNLQTRNELIVESDSLFMNTGEGLHRFVDPVDNEVYLYTQFEVPDSRRVFAVFEQPDLKATFAFSITAPSHWKVVSNQTSPAPDAAGEGKATWNFAPSPRISSYITAIIAGPYVETRSSLTSSDGREIPLGVFSRASLAQFMDADYIFEKTRQGFEFYEKAFDQPYPFEKYDQLFVPEFNAGAMENAGAVTFTETYVFRSKVTDAIRERRVVTILHELAHMWFGDLVTMKWWNDLWLNESFAEYASTLATAEATEWKGAWTTFTALEKSWAYRQDQLPSTHPIVAEINDLADVQVNFDGITYAKGASVLKQLVAWVGQEKFLAGVASYFKKHAYQNTELSDLLVELEAQSGRELRSWSKLWLETAGVNTLRPIIVVDESNKITSFVVKQTAIDEHPTLRPHRMAIGFYNLVDGKLTRVHRLELDVDGATTNVDELVGLDRPDLVLLNDDDLAYSKIRLDDHSLNTALSHLSNFDDSLARTLIWGAAWDATRDAETSPRDFIKLVLNNIATETESTTMLTLLRQLTTAAHLYVAPQNREAALAEIGDGLLALARNAEPGSDAQLQFTKFFASFASTASQLDALEALFVGKEMLPQLTIDADLRWELLAGLVVGGRRKAQDIDAELASDNTANGQKAAAGARAALPTAADKETAWKLLTETHKLSNVLVDAASLGFVRVNDGSLIEPFVDRYFANVVRIWNDNTFKIAEYLIENLYPSIIASPELVAKSKQAIERAEIAEIPALKRILVEGLANVERALAAQARDLKG
ncbi:aminopeptidase N [Rhodoluna sp.]|uniref:aminopeptidase N n=1 Tax=Rhodoluna sp. TaxID=1969481 RepID=UPI0025EBBD7D|nr:aminopeptidase N [Rhodoluna sp.]